MRPACCRHGAIDQQSGVTQTTDYEPLRKVYASYAPEYDRKWRKYTRRTLARAVRALPRSARSVLDVGCGTGVLLGELRRLRPALRVIGVDASPEMLARARERLPEDERTSWQVATAETLPTDLEPVDVIYCTNAFHLVQDADRAVRGFRRVLTDEGTVVIVDWCRDFRTMEAMQRLMPLKDKQPRTLRTLPEMTSLLERHHFHIERADRFKASWFWGLMLVVARKCPAS